MKGGGDMKNKTSLISLETEKFLFFKIISSIIVALVPIAVAFVIDKRFIAMLPAYILPLVYLDKTALRSARPVTESLYSPSLSR